MSQDTKLTDMSDIDLIQQSLKGSKTAYTLLMRRYQEPMYRYLMSLTGSHADTDDLLQDVMLKLWTQLSNLKLKNEYSLHSWLKTTAYHAFLNYKERVVNKGGPKVSIDDDEVGYNEMAADDSPEDDVNEVLVSNEIYRALDGLPEKQRETVILRFIEGEKFSEIAAQMGVSESTAKTNASHGLKNLAMAYPELKEILVYANE